MAPLFTANWFNFGRNPSAGGAAAVPFTASGGEEFTEGSSWYHVFWCPASAPNGDVGPYTSHTFTHSGGTGKNIDILMVGGGGAGCGGMGSGGGGGGVIFYPDLPLNNVSADAPIVIGGGGNSPNAPTQGDPGQAGGPSAFDASTSPAYLVALGGGGASRYSVTEPIDWGSPTDTNPASPAITEPTSGPNPQPSPDSYHGMSGGSGGGAGQSSGPNSGGLGRQENTPHIPANSRTYGHGNPGGAVSTYNSNNFYNRAGGGGGSTAGGNQLDTAPNSPGFNKFGWGGQGYQCPTSFLPPTGTYPNTFLNTIGGVPKSNNEFRYFGGGGAGGSNG